MSNSNAEKVFLGLPIDFKGLFKVYPPTVNQTLDVPDFDKFLSLLTISQEDIEDQLFNADDEISIKKGQIPTPYQYLAKVCEAGNEYLDIIQRGFKFFTHIELTFIPEKEFFLIGNLEEILQSIQSLEDLPILTPELFFDFQNTIRLVMGREEVEPYDYNQHPRARRMRAKARYRDRIKAKQNAKTDSLINSLASICCMGIGLTPLNIGEMSYAAISTITTKYQKKEKYTLDIDSLLAGADSKKVKPKYWMSENDK